MMENKLIISKFPCASWSSISSDAIFCCLSLNPIYLGFDLREGPSISDILFRDRGWCQKRPLRIEYHPWTTQKRSLRNLHKYFTKGPGSHQMPWFLVIRTKARFMHRPWLIFIFQEKSELLAKIHVSFLINISKFVFWYFFSKFNKWQIIGFQVIPMKKIRPMETMAHKFSSKPSVRDFVWPKVYFMHCLLFLEQPFQFWSILAS